jgi:hypothetical protein
VLLKAILCFIGCRKVNGYAPEYVPLNTIIFTVIWAQLSISQTWQKKYLAHILQCQVLLPEFSNL